MPLPPLEILYEDNHLLVLNKPAGLPTMGTPGGSPTLLTAAKDYIKEKYQKPGNVYLGVMSRLDAPVTGVVLFARTSKAAARMTEQFRGRTVRKTYWTLVAGSPRPASGGYTNWLVQDERHRRMHVVDSTFSGAKECVSITACSPPTARYRSWRWSWKPGGSTRYGCKWPITGTPLSATANTAASCGSPRASRCTPGGWSSLIRCGARSWSSKRRCRSIGRGVFNPFLTPDSCHPCEDAC